MRIPILIVAAVVAIGTGGVALGAPVSVQVAKGQASFASNCASCHGPTLGGAFGPPLKGAEFFKQWNLKTARNLYSRILTTMPASAPGTLSPKTVVDLTIYLLTQNGVHVGSKAKKSPDQLNSILIKH